VSRSVPDQGVAPTQRPTDETERPPRRAEAFLAASEAGGSDAFLTDIVNGIANPVFVKDEQHRFIFLNDAFCAILGRARTAVLGCTDLDFLPADEARRFWEQDALVLATGMPHDSEDTLTDAAGARHYLVTRKSIVNRADGTSCLVAVISDITELKRAEQRLADSERLKSVVIASSLDAIITVDAAGRVVQFNPAAEQMFGYACEVAQGQPMPDLIIPPRYRQRHRDGLARYLATGASQILGRRIELMAMRGDGSEFPVELAITATTLNGAPQFTAFLRDITERKQVKDALLAATAQAETANRAKSEFLANMSHELRTPLNAVVGFSEVLRDQIMGPLDERYREYAGDINSAGRHLLDVINEVLDLSKIEVGRLDLRDETVSIGEIVEACRRVIAGEADAAGVTLILNLPANLPLLRADEMRFKQILLNLLSNAVKFTPTGGSISVTAATTAAGLVITVADTGIGMAAEDIPVALEPFRQIDSTLSRRYEGTGLGLPLAKRLAELHDGELEIESQPGRGTTVHIRLPAGRMVEPAPWREDTGERRAATITETGEK
jgi:PAS domain S-box-containing protein